MLRVEFIYADKSSTVLSHQVSVSRHQRRTPFIWVVLASILSGWTTATNRLLSPNDK